MTEQDREMLIRIDERVRRLDEWLGERESSCEEIHQAIDVELKDMRSKISGWRTTAVALGAVLLTVAAQNAGPLVTFLRATIP